MENAWGIIFLILELLFFIGFPLLFVVSSIIVLIRIFSNKTFKTDSKPELITTTTTVLDRREQTKINRYNGVVTYYYVTVDCGLDDRMEFMVSKREYNKLSVGDVVKVSYLGERLKELKLVKKGC